MASGQARRLHLQSYQAFADLLASMPSGYAITLGALRSDLPGNVMVTTKSALSRSQQGNPPNLIARSAEFICFRTEQPALALIDIDTKGLSDSARSVIASLGGFDHALASVLPDLNQTARVFRASTSSGLCRTDTHEVFPWSGGFHCYLQSRTGRT